VAVPVAASRFANASAKDIGRVFSGDDEPDDGVPVPVSLGCETGAAGVGLGDETGPDSGTALVVILMSLMRLLPLSRAGRSSDRQKSRTTEKAVSPIVR